MTKKNKILISAGVITPVAIMTITLPIVLTKKSNNTEQNKKEVLQILKKIRTDDLFIISNDNLSLNKEENRAKIIDRIVEVYGLSKEEKKLLKIETSSGIISDKTPLKVTIIIFKGNSNEKIEIIFTRKDDNVNNNKLKELVAKIKKTNLIIDNLTNLDLTMANDRKKIIDKIQELNGLTDAEKQLLSLKTISGTINQTEKDVVVTIAISSDSKTDITFKVKINITQYKGVINGVFTSRDDFKIEVEKYSKGSDYKTKIPDSDAMSDEYINLDNVKLADDLRLNFDDFSRIQWKGVINLNDKNNPFKGDISNKTLLYNWVGNLDMSRVTKWPIKDVRFRGYNGNTKVGVNLFKGDMSTKSVKMEYFEKNASGNKIDVSSVTKWFDQVATTWETFYGHIFKNVTSNPFVGNLSGKIIKHIWFDGIDLSEITHHANEYNFSSFKNSIKSDEFFKGDLSKVIFKYNHFLGVDLSNVNKWKLSTNFTRPLHVFGNVIDRNTKGNITKLFSTADNIIFSTSSILKFQQSLHPYIKDIATKLKDGHFTKKENIVKYLPKIEKIYQLLKNNHDPLLRKTNDFFGTDVSDWKFSKENNVVFMDFHDFTGVKGFEKIKDGNNINKGYKTITDWVKGEIIPSLTSVITTSGGTNTFFKDIKMAVVNMFAIRWKDNPNDAKYKYLHSLYDDTNTDVNFKWPKK